MALLGDTPPCVSWANFFILIREWEGDGVWGRRPSWEEAVTILWIQGPEIRVTKYAFFLVQFFCTRRNPRHTSRANLSLTWPATSFSSSRATTAITLASPKILYWIGAPIAHDNLNKRIRSSFLGNTTVQEHHYVGSVISSITPLDTILSNSFLTISWRDVATRLAARAAHGLAFSSKIISYGNGNHGNKIIWKIFV